MGREDGVLQNRAEQPWQRRLRGQTENCLPDAVPKGLVEEVPPPVSPVLWCCLLCVWCAPWVGVLLSWLLAVAGSDVVPMLALLLVSPYQTNESVLPLSPCRHHWHLLLASRRHHFHLWGGMQSSLRVVFGDQNNRCSIFGRLA